MSKLSLRRTICLACVFCAAAAIGSHAQDAPVFTSLFSFDGTDRANPDGSLVQGFDGNLYATASLGGASVCGPGGCGTSSRSLPAAR